ncbi:Mth938-like domain-containing protein [Streptomyces sp. 5.8]|uniref:Mth938-like domain-containing protein n=1 Tax=Streptomyces sp. 5.8 TaxID=3406571 RepID=UPI003BB6AC62
MPLRAVVKGRMPRELLSRRPHTHHALDDAVEQAELMSNLMAWVPPVRSPLVTHLDWGRMEVEGLPAGKDFVLYPGGGRSWDWGEHGTRHEPGIQPADVAELLDRGCTVAVLSRGMALRLGVMPQTLRLLRDAGVEVHVEETPAAVALYNRLAATERVGGLFHSTC